jgi:methionyl-tRNA formyltransferase
MTPRVVFLGNAFSAHSVAFLRELHRLGADVRLVVGSGRAPGARKAPPARLAHVLRHFTLGEIAAALLVRACARLGALAACRGLLEERSLAAAAARLGLPYLDCAGVNQPQVVARVAAAQPDLLLVHSFSEILRAPLIETARLGAFNFHPGRLPQNRGPHPLEHGVLLREREVTTTCHWLAERVDAGDVVVAASQSLDGAASFAEVERRSRAASARALQALLQAVATPPLPRTPQDEGEARSHPRATASDKRAARRLARSLYRRPA